MKNLNSKRQVDRYLLELDKENMRLLTFMQRWIRKNYGERCKKLANRCPICIAWRVYDLVITVL